jgi:hypothetical protein
MTSKMVNHEYVFDVKLYSVVRIQAVSRRAAELALRNGLAAANLTLANGENEAQVIEVSLDIDDVDYPHLIKFDGEELDENERFIK